MLDLTQLQRRRSTGKQDGKEVVNKGTGCVCVSLLLSLPVSSSDLQTIQRTTQLPLVPSYTALPDISMVPLQD